MDLLKENIHMSQIKKMVNTQITSEDDFNVPDIKPDIDYIIADDATIVMDNIKVLDGRVLVKGRLEFKILYATLDSSLLQQMSGSIPIDETINAEDIKDDDCVTVKYDLDDINIGVINSRKISVKALITFTIQSENIYDIETATDMQGEDVYFEKNSIDITKLAECKKDIFRIKEEIELPSSHPEIAQFLWDDTKIKNLSTKLGDNSLIISGEINTCIIYQGADSPSILWHEDTIPFNGSLPLSGIDETMIPDIEVNMSSKNINIKADSDGEERVLEFDIVLDLNIKIYKEVTLNYLSDIYSNKCELVPAYSNVTYNQLIIKNISKCKVNDKLKVDADKGHILQICGSEGEVKAEDLTVVDGGIKVEGVIIVNLLSITDNDKVPVMVIKEVIPFTHTIEASTVDENSLICIRPTLEQLFTTMNNGNEIEVKATASLDTLVLGSFNANIITNITENPRDLDKLQAMPGLMGYKVKEDDTLFKIAKRFSTTTKDIKDINGLTSDIVASGDFLLIVKNVG
ncbi:MAG: DUF3794 domain-containing protein [Lachnospiraceae bacterium]|nr:DUF3794 domain-containing protein [Lachnospiraceae bacterium]